MKSSPTRKETAEKFRRLKKKFAYLVPVDHIHRKVVELRVLNSTSKKEKKKYHS
jgi:hypothetical protein